MKALQPTPDQASLATTEWLLLWLTRARRGWSGGGGYDSVSVTTLIRGDARSDWSPLLTARDITQ